MNNFEIGQCVWWLSGVNSENCVGAGMQPTTISSVNVDGSLNLKNDVAEFPNVDPSCVFWDKQDAIAEAVRRLQDVPAQPKPAEAPKPKEDVINHPVHYNSGKAHCECGRKIECIDVAKNYCFALGNVIKYIWRAGVKDNSTELEDLKKARWYLDNKIKSLENGSTEKLSK